jgi:hypothetical protein
MTNEQQHAQAAETAFRATKVDYATWRRNVAAGKYPALGPPSQWGIGFQHLQAISESFSTKPAEPGSTGQPVTTIPYSDGIALNIQATGTSYADIAIDGGSGDSAILVGSGGSFKSKITMRRVRIRKAAVGNKVPYGKHGVYMDCFNSSFLDFDIQGSPACSNGFSIRMGGTIISRATVSDCFFPIGVFDSDTGQSDGTVLVEDVTGLFTHDTAVWCDAQDDFKTTFDLKLTFRRCSMTGPGAFLKATRVRNGTFRFEQCLLNGRPVAARDVPAGSVIV